MYSHFIVLALVGAASASLPGLNFGRSTMRGLASFNNYAAQGSTVCGPISGTSGTYGAAASDISPDISGGLCYGQIDMNNCDGRQPVSGYAPPGCPKSNCGLCYTVTNKGGYDGSKISGVGNSIVVQIIDSCPSVNAWNYCKTDVPRGERCMSHAVNQLDIDQSAYQALTGMPFGSGPNLDIHITPTLCP